MSDMFKRDDRVLFCLFAVDWGKCTDGAVCPRKNMGQAIPALSEQKKGGKGEEGEKSEQNI